MAQCNFTHFYCDNFRTDFVGIMEILLNIDYRLWSPSKRGLFHFGFDKDLTVHLDFLQ